MADQAALDSFRAQIKSDTQDAIRDLSDSVGEVRRQLAVLLGAGDPVSSVNEHAIADQVWSAQFADMAAPDGPLTAAHTFLTETSRRAVEAEQRR